MLITIYNKANICINTLPEKSKTAPKTQNPENIWGRETQILLIYKFKNSTWIIWFDILKFEIMIMYIPTQTNRWVVAGDWVKNFIKNI